MFAAYEADEMFNLFVCRFKQFAHFGTSKKVPKEKEFMKFLGQEKPKKVQSYMTEEKKETLLQDNLTLEEALAIKRDPTKFHDTYQPKDVEKYWYQWWETKKFFHANENTTNPKRYIMVLPPPNVTGYLHLGHALTSAIEDTLIRTYRMRGYETLYVPGTDHAGIATQAVVEKHLLKSEGITKYDLGRDKFTARVWEWKEKHGNWILSQLRRVGSSLDWDRYLFTMDPSACVAVTEAFVRLHEMGLIYRANRLVNWSSRMRTAISDIEVDYIDIEQPIEIEVPGHKGKYPFGYLTHFAYKVKDSDEEIVVATTRLETMLGDVAVAVNSKDPRYTHLHGKKLVHPFIKDREVVVICDDELVDMNFGTGAVKVTPGHDPRDYDCGLRHNLPQITIFAEDGSINELGGPYAKMMRFDARIKMEEDMKNLGIYRKKEVNKMRLGICSRSKDIIEPMLKPQWYINCQTIKARMIEVVKTKELNIIPADHERTWFDWIEGLRDWCISRQIWWGHRCPAYVVSIDGKELDSRDEKSWVIGRNEQEAKQKASVKFNVPFEAITLRQDEDVLDTWFSSGLFPFSTMGWPNKDSKDLAAFFPNTILETGWDILFFWVARMVQFGLWLHNTLPFKYVFLHPIIRDKDGKKMSKSSGNVIDPVEIIDGTTLENLKKKVLEGNLPANEIERTIKQKEADFPEGIPECGSDALRFGLLAYMQRALNINLDVLRIIGYRQFCNKIWQTIKFGLSKLPKEIKYEPNRSSQNYALINKWILSKLTGTVQLINKNIDEYEFGYATQNFQHFWQYQLCDVYLESIKYIFTEKNNDEVLKAETQHTLMTCLETGLRLLHPMMPFLSEELWQKLPKFEGRADSLCIAQYPEFNPHLFNQQAEQDFDVLQNIARSLRQISSAANLPPSTRPDAFIHILDDQHIQALIVAEQAVLISISRTAKVEILPNVTDQVKSFGQGSAGEKIKLYVNLKQHINIEQEVSRLSKKLEELEKFIVNLEKKVSAYSDKVPQKVRDEDTLKMEKFRKEQSIVLEQIENLKN